MNWYKLAQQVSFPFLDNQEFQIPSYGYTQDDETQFDCEDFNEFEDLVVQCSTEAQLITLFKKCHSDYDKIETPSGIIYQLLIDGESFVVEDFSIQSAEEWVRDKSWSGRTSEYITMRDFNEEFWESADGVLVYHGTAEDRLQDILTNGLEPRDETRGIANRSMGAGVFTSPDAGQADYFYDRVIEINVGAMKADNLILPVSMEGPIEESEAEDALAHMVGLEDYHADVEQGLDPGTVVFYGVIPPNFLRLVE